MVDKLTKKELEQPDEFHTIGWRAMQYISEHRNKFYGAGAGVLLIIILSGLWYFSNLNYENKAERMYSSAYNSYYMAGSNSDMKGAYLNAVGIYTKLVEKYPDSRAAILSFLIWEYLF